MHYRQAVGWSDDGLVPVHSCALAVPAVDRAPKRHHQGPKQQEQQDGFADGLLRSFGLARLNVGDDGFVPQPRRFPHHRCVQHGRMARDGALYLGGVHVEARTDDPLDHLTYLLDRQLPNSLIKS